MLGKPSHPQQPWLSIHAVAFFSLSVEGAMGVIFPLLLIELEAPVHLLGALVGLAALGPLLLSVPAGILCDRYGDRAVLIACALVALVTSLLYVVSQSLWGLVLLQLVGGTARSTAWLAAQSYVSRVVTSTDRGTRMGQFTFAANLSMLVTPPLLGFLAATYSASSAFFGMAAWCLVLLVIALRLPRYPSQQGAPNSAWMAPRRTLEAATRMVCRRELAPVLIATFLRLGTIAVAQSFYPVYLHGLGYSATQIGWMFTLMYLSSTVVAPSYGRLARRFPEGSLLWVSAGLSVVGICLVPLVDSTAALIPLALLHGAGIGLSLPVLLSEMATRTAAEERGLAVAVRSVVNRLGYLTVPTALGLAVAGFGLGPSVLGAGAAMGAIIGWGMRLDRGR
jgi:predicted MFS family arabinose efflux permease